MKASHIAIIVLICCVTILLLLGSLGLYTQQQNVTALQEAIRAAQLRADEQARETGRLRDQLQENAREYAARQAAQEPPPAEAAGQQPPANPATTAPQSFQARTFAGDKYIGISWVIPSNVTVDQETGQTRFEPVILLGDQARNAITQTKTNTVDREVVNHNTLQQSYYYQQPYWYGYPVWVRGHPVATNLPAVLPGARPPGAGLGGGFSNNSPASGPVATPPGAVGRVVPPKPAGSR